nr:immunoglobulin light chain junction region [Macaca mulatta]MOW36219.1 immunoglobulin light chain junction region [Macaca mulatta]MOW36244.1 immunoglobulin light chain junction region [Macaca mulatta]MOW36510.1 immunoglobulin light chain junction region [Macaca mulatta]MOW36605.1 immunoglobulin light chain junction region [Macaca mulatta]
DYYCMIWHINAYVF